jgi:hypothetical protein
MQELAYDVDTAQQIVGRERSQRACHRELVRNVVVARRVNSDVRAHRYLENPQRSASLTASENARLLDRLVDWYSEP